MKVEIYRSTWNRGKIGPDLTYLYDPVTETMDATGFLCNALRVPWVALGYCMTVTDIHRDWRHDLDMLLFDRGTDKLYATCFAEEIMDLNDDLEIDETTREIRLSILFADAGFELEFHD